MDGKDRLCPSAPPSEEAVIIAVSPTPHDFSYIRPPLPVGSSASRFKTDADSLNFRFAAPCAEERCGHWRSSRCGLIDALLGPRNEQELEESATNSLPRCGIRPTCRWFAQKGRAACRTCSTINTGRPFFYSEQLFASPD